MYKTGTIKSIKNRHKGIRKVMEEMNLIKAHYMHV
jgi:hypothetical protein